MWCDVILVMCSMFSSISVMSCSFALNLALLLSCHVIYCYVMSCHHLISSHLIPSPAPPAVGHYIASAQNPCNDRWYRYDDSLVTELELSALGGDDTDYLLFYRQREEQGKRKAMTDTTNVKVQMQEKNGTPVANKISTPKTSTTIPRINGTSQSSKISTPQSHPATSTSTLNNTTSAKAPTSALQNGDVASPH